MKVGSIHKNSKTRYFAVGGYFSYEEDKIKIKAKYKKENYNIPYPTYLKQLWNVENYIHKTPILNNSIINKYNEYKNKNFIFLSPEAKSVLPINENFWKKLKAQINKKGYEIIQNEKNLTFEEAYYIASLSKGIITLRSGISELLSMLPIQQHIIYTKHKFSKISVNKTKEVHSIVNYPFVDCKLIYEYEYENNEKNNNEIIRQIIERI